MELICFPAPVKDIWPEIEEHTFVLLRNELAGTPHLIFADSRPMDTSSRSIVELAATHLCHPCFAVAQAAQRSLGKLLLQGMPGVTDVLMDCFDRSESHQEAALAVLDAVALTDPSSVSGFRAKIEELINSPNWSIRSMAGSIINTCDWVVPISDRGFRPLPPIYCLELPPRTLDVSLEQVRLSPRAPVRDSSDPRITVFPFNDQIEAIASIADVPEDKLYTRIVEIMRELASPESWSEEAQANFDSSLRSAGLRLPRASSRLRVARRAMFYAVTELQDAGNISQGGARALERRLRTYDPRMVLVEPSHRPASIGPISGLEFMDNVSKWTDAAEEALQHTDWTPDDDLVVLAEHTIIAKRRPWESPRETRYSTLEPLVSSPFPISRDPEALFGIVSNRTVEEYEFLITYPDSYPLVIQHVAPGFHSPGNNWIALNPSVAQRLGWSPAKEGMFRWVDSEGAIKVESVWWVDGLLGHSTHGPSSEEIGEGWLVLASQSALEEIQREIGHLIKHSIVVRRYNHEGEPVEHSVASSNLL